MIDITSKRFKTIVEATTNGILTEMEAVELLNTTPQSYRVAVDEFFLMLNGKTTINKKKTRSSFDADNDTISVEYEDRASFEVVRCRERRKVETCKQCLWFKQNCPHLAKEKENKRK